MKSALTAMLLGILLIPLTAGAEIYRWVNDRGIASYTDNLGNVPAKFRTKAVLIDEPVPAVQEVVIEPVATKERGTGDDKKETKQASDDQKKKLYGGKDEATWKKESDRMNQQVTETDKQIGEIRSRLTDTSKMSRTEYLSLQNTAKLLEQRLETQKQQRDSFLESARKAGAPL